MMFYLRILELKKQMKSLNKLVILQNVNLQKNALPLDVDESTFISTLVQTLETLKVGILRLENLVL